MGTAISPPGNFIKSRILAFLEQVGKFVQVDDTLTFLIKGGRPGGVIHQQHGDALSIPAGYIRSMVAAAALVSDSQQNRRRDSGARGEGQPEGIHGIWR